MDEVSGSRTVLDDGTMTPRRTLRVIVDPTDTY